MGFLDQAPTLDLGIMEMFGQTDHAEGICMAPDGTTYVSGEAGQIYRIEGDTTVEVTTTGGWTFGLASDAEGRIYACDGVHQAVMRWTPGGGPPEVWSRGPEDAPFQVPNWGAFGPDGTYYISDSGGWKQRGGRLIAIRNGQASVWTEESVDFPNGLAVTPDGKELWVLESTPGCLVRYPIRDDGSAGPREVVAELTGTVPDGIAFTTDGSAIIACYRPDAILRWTPGQGVSLFASDPEGVYLAAPTNLVFAGPERDTIVTPNIGRWHVTRFRVPGLVGVPLFYPTREQLGS
jgi:gluconolactonase